MRKLLLIMLSITAFIGKIDAQEIGIKTNFAYWASASPNLGLEIGLGKQTTLDISAGFNFLTTSSGNIGLYNLNFAIGHANDSMDIS